MRPYSSEAIGQGIRQQRRLLDWTQRQLSEKAGVTFIAVAKIESGFPIDDDLLQKIAHALNQEAG
jgi:transcriptional regulator with XRE-family HTH domain